jgi:hypothetical protein
MQWPQLKTFLVCQEIQGSIDTPGFSLTGVMPRELVLPRRHTEGETPYPRLSVYVEVFTGEPVETESVSLRMSADDGGECQYLDGAPPTVRKDLTNVPGGVSCHFVLDCLGMYPGEYTFQALWGERVLATFPFRIRDREDNPRLAEQQLVAQAV